MINDAPKISIIVPVFNTASYLEQCLNSLVNQSIHAIEIICVNDGSTDNSLEILQDFAKKDGRIQVFSQENQGQSIARNKAMKIAKGEYLGFVDPDDWCEVDMFKKLYANAQKFDSDIAMCSFILFNDKTNDYAQYDPYFTLETFSDKFDNQAFSPDETFGFIFRVCVSACNKIFKKSFITEHNMIFPEGLFFEDNVFFLETFLNAKKISLIRENLYVYRRFSNTSTCSGADYKKMDLFKVFDLMEAILTEKKLLPDNKKLSEYFCQYRIYTLIYWYKKLSEDDIKLRFKKEFIKLFKAKTPVRYFILRDLKLMIFYGRLTKAFRLLLKNWTHNV